MFQQLWMFAVYIVGKEKDHAPSKMASPCWFRNWGNENL
jgi:hypothetical protein